MLTALDQVYEAERPLPSRIVVILGMHRSGTSCLTGSLQEAGLQLGSCHTWNPYNLKGNRENQAFVDLHDAILEANGASWDRPPRRVAWSRAHSDMALDLLRAHADFPILGFKDPRTLLVIRGWRALVPSLEQVGIFRHPEAVARSLEHRSNLERDHALGLWYHYNRLLLREYRRKPFPILCFDETEDVFQQKLGDLVAGLDLPGELSSPRFYDRELKHYDDDSLAGSPWRIRRLYRKLRRVSV